MNIPNPELDLAWRFVEYTNKNIFLTGKAGTGKTTFLKNLKIKSPKRSIIVAPTGVAAINAGGVTIHSFFQMPFGPHIPRESITGDETRFAAGHTKISKSKIDIIRSIDLLIIDEISMVRADLLDGIDEVLRRYRNTTKPFGGVQLLMIGDIQQLAPIVKDEEKEMLRPYYSTFYFYGSRALQKTDFVSIELKYIYRQSDKYFIDILNSIRENKIEKELLIQLNKQYKPGFEQKENEGYIILTTHNAKARDVNQSRLNKLKGKAKTFKASIEGEFPEYLYPADFELTLKTGAQVMFIKNDPSAEKEFYNGKIGIIDSIDEEEQLVHIKCPEDDSQITVGRLTWENCKYNINEETKEIQETVTGRFEQIPLKLAWAITIHKSQGLTFEKAIIDAQSSFAHGQVYVAFSRCRTLEGLVLSSPIDFSSIKSDKNVNQFSETVSKNPPDNVALENAKEEFRKSLIFDLFDFSNLSKSMYRCLKIVKENQSSLLAGLEGEFNTINEKLKNNILSVSEKFNRQLIELLSVSMPLQNKELLQERIKKASGYFNKNLSELILTPLKKIPIDSDNKKVKTDLKNVVGKLHNEALLKKLCLEKCTDGFEVKKYLDIRAKASIEQAESRKSKSSDITDNKIPDNKLLFEVLRQWRLLKAEELGVELYRVISQRALVGIADKMPSTVGELLDIHGIGRKKVNTFGKEILEVIWQYCKQKNIGYKPDFDSSPAMQKAKEQKPDTKQISFDLYNSGKNIEEIAAERGLVASTIEGHLAHFVQIGDIDVLKFLPESSLKEIIQAIEEYNTTSLSPLAEILEYNYDYRELRFAVSHFKFINKV